MFGSSAINKSTRKFAPKAPGRRRPGAAAAAQPSQSQPAESTQTSTDGPAREAVVPTEPSTQPEHLPADSAPVQNAQPANQPEHASIPGTAPSTATQSAQSTALHTPIAVAKPIPPIAAEAETSRVPQVVTTVEDGTGERSPKRRRIETTETARPTPTPVPTPAAPRVEATPQESATATGPTANPRSSPLFEPAPVTSATTAVVSAPPEAPPVDSQGTAPSNNDAASANDSQPPQKTRAPRKPRTVARKSKENDGQAVEASVEGQEGGEEAASTQTEARPVTKPRKPRKAHPKKTQQGTEGAVTEGEAGSDGVTAVAKPKRRAPRKKTTPAESRTGEGEEDGAAVSRRGRKLRSPTPEDAQEQEIAPDEISMADLIRVRTGKVSTREMAMREINWEEVNQRRREQLLAQAQQSFNNGAQDDEVEARLNEAAGSRGAGRSEPRLRLVNGVMTIDQDSLVRDRHAEAIEHEDELEEHEENDLTTRVNTQTWVLANRREPDNRLMFPGNNKKWDGAQTEAFYEALRMFGTDFYLISKMFPGKTRRQIKQKFVREERAAPDRVKAALVGTDRLTMDFSTFLQATGQQETEFKDPRQLERELAEEHDAQLEEIERQRRLHQEMVRQKKMAGLGEEGDDDAGADDDGPGRGRKKGKKDRKKQMAEKAEDVEILETFDD